MPDGEHVLGFTYTVEDIQRVREAIVEQSKPAVGDNAVVSYEFRLPGIPHSFHCADRFEGPDSNGATEDVGFTSELAGTPEPTEL